MSVAEAGYIDNSVNSKTFWNCLEYLTWPDAIDIISIILEVTAIILNTFTGVLLSRVKDGDRVSLVLLRTFVFNNVIDAVIKLIGDVTPAREEFTNVNFNYFLCYIWDTRFLYWLFNIYAIEALTMFAVDRAFCLRKIDFYPFVTMESRLRAYLAIIYIFGIVITVPEFLTVNLKDGDCTCQPSQVNVPVLTVIYAHTFLRCFLLVIINGGIQLACSTAVILWVRDTHCMNQCDELNYIHLTPLNPAELKRLKEHHTWKTPSMCLLPLAILFIISFGFDAFYQFFSGTGITTYVINGAPQRAGTMMLAAFSTAAPIILLIFIPGLRFWLEKQFRRLKC